jgi:hypothetical protein
MMRDKGGATERHMEIIASYLTKQPFSGGQSQ